MQKHSQSKIIISKGKLIILIENIGLIWFYLNQLNLFILLKKLTEFTAKFYKMFISTIPMTNIFQNFF